MGMVGETREVDAHAIQLQAARDLQRFLIAEKEPDATPSEGMGGITINITLDRERRGSQGSHGAIDRPTATDRGNARLISVDAKIHKDQGLSRPREPLQTIPTRKGLPPHSSPVVSAG